MNVLMTLSNPFTHDPRVYNEAKSLIETGYNVTILSWDRGKENPLIEFKDEVKIVRIYNTKFMDLLPYNILRLRFWLKEGYKKALSLHRQNSINVIHCHNLDTLMIGVKLKKKLGLPLIYDAHEIWGYMVAKDLPKLWANYYLRKEKQLIKNVNEIIIAEDKYTDYFSSITNKKLTSILNCKHLISKKYSPPNNKSLILLYIGTLNSTRFLLELSELVKDIQNVECIIGGIGKPEFVEKLRKKCLTTKNVKFIDRVPPEKVIPMTQKSSVVVCMINPNVINNKIATANKQFEAMVCGRPIICTKGTRSGEITEAEKCGLVVEYSKVALKEAIIKLRDSPDLREELGCNALTAAINKYNWKIEEKKLLQLYEKVKMAK